MYAWYTKNSDQFIYEKKLSIVLLILSCAGPNGNK